MQTSTHKIPRTDRIEMEVKIAIKLNNKQLQKCVEFALKKCKEGKENESNYHICNTLDHFFQDMDWNTISHEDREVLQILVPGFANDLKDRTMIDGWVSFK